MSDYTFFRGHSMIASPQNDTKSDSPPPSLHLPNFTSLPTKFTRIQLVSIISDGLQMSLLILTKVKRMDQFQICMTLKAKC